MHTVELLEAAIDLAERSGYRVRQEWMGGAGAGNCEIKGRKWLFLDLSLSPAEQLEIVLGALGGDPASAVLPMPAELRTLLPLRKTA